MVRQIVALSLRRRYLATQKREGHRCYALLGRFVPGRHHLYAL